MTCDVVCEQATGDESAQRPCVSELLSALWLDPSCALHTQARLDTGQATWTMCGLCGPDDYSNAYCMPGIIDTSVGQAYIGTSIVSTRQPTCAAVCECAFATWFVYMWSTDQCAGPVQTLTLACSRSAHASITFPPKASDGRSASAFCRPSQCTLAVEWSLDATATLLMKRKPRGWAACCSLPGRIPTPRASHPLTRTSNIL